MRLCDKDIYRYIQEGKIKIDPTPDYDQISGVTVDVRLSNKFRVFQDHAALHRLERRKRKRSEGA